jgi:CHAD domain-containing protein
MAKAASPVKIPRVPVHSLHDATVTALDGAIRCLNTGLDDESVHAARKACKRVRAGLRLLRDSLGTRVYRRENSRVRDAVKPLTAVRDACVLQRAARSLPVRSGALERALKSVYVRERQALERDGARVALAHLEAARASLVDLPPPDAEVDSAVAAIGRVYRAGRKALSTARSRDDESLHEWRKQSKYLLNELECLKSVFGISLTKRRRRADRLAEVLGDDHDLAVLSVMLERLRVVEPSRDVCALPTAAVSTSRSTSPPTARNS